MDWAIKISDCYEEIWSSLPPLKDKQISQQTTVFVKAPVFQPFKYWWNLIDWCIYGLPWQFHDNTIGLLSKQQEIISFFFLILMILMKSNWQMYLWIAVAISWQYHSFFVKAARNHLFIFILTTSLNWYLIVLGAKWRSNAYQQWLTYFLPSKVTVAWEKESGFNVYSSL